MKRPIGTLDLANAALYALTVIKATPEPRSRGTDYAEFRLATVLAGNPDPGMDAEALDRYLEAKQP